MGDLFKNIDFGSVLQGGMSTAIDGFSGLLFAKQQNKMTKDLMNYQNNLNIANWKMANEYNLPKNQMQRYREAGLNPNLIYGKLDNSASMVASPSAQSASIDRRSSLLQNIQVAANLRQMEAQTKLLNAKTLRENVEAAYTEERSKQQQWYNSDDYRSNALKLLTGQANYMTYHADIEENNAYWAPFMNRMKYDLQDAKRILYGDEHDLNALRSELLKSNNDLVQSKIILNGAMLLTQSAMADNFRAHAALARKNVEYLAKGIDKICSEIGLMIKNGQKIDAEIINKRIHNYLLSVFGREELTGEMTQISSILTAALNKIQGKRLAIPDDTFKVK